MALTAKEEAFARGVALDKLGQNEAYSKACDTSKLTPKSISEAASRMAANPQVQARIQVLAERATAAALKKAGATLADAIAEADELVADGKALGQISAAVAASKLKAQLAGHLDDKKEEKKNDLDAMDVEGLIHIREEVNVRLAKAREALELCGELPTAPVPMRRVIG